MAKTAYRLDKLEFKNADEILNQLGLKEKGLVQKFLDNEVVMNLQPYVSFRTGTQERSIKIATVLGSGLVKIDVNYAEVQAYSKKIHKRNGLRGTRPFERMVEDKKSTILNDVANYARSLDK